jgi:DNA-binding CsgD family transcriptional regulator
MRRAYSLLGVFPSASLGRTVEVRAMQEVPMAETVTEHDLRRLLAVIEEGRRDHPTEGMPWAVLEGLAALVPCEEVSFPEADLAHGHQMLCQWYRSGDRAITFGDDGLSAEFWEHLEQFAPCNYPQRTGDLTSAVRWSDFYTTTELHNTPLFTEYFAPGGWTHGLHLSFPTLPGHFRKISFWRRTEGEFTERDRLVVELLRPHLWETYIDAQRRRRHLPQLSAREWEVLRLAHEGYGNSEIARRLFISVATVRKHMEHIFDRTGVHTRTAAAALMIPHYDTTPDRPWANPAIAASGLRTNAPGVGVGRW